MVNESEDKLVIVLLNTINDRLTRIERWMENHDNTHRDRAEDRTDIAVQYENRLTRLESGVNIKSAVGALVAIIYIVLETIRQIGVIR